MFELGQGPDHRLYTHHGKLVDYGIVIHGVESFDSVSDGIESRGNSHVEWEAHGEIDVVNHHLREDLERRLRGLQAVFCLTDDGRHLI